MAFENNRKGAVKKLKCLAYTSKSETASFREKIENTFNTPVLPNRVERIDYNYGGVDCDVLAPEIYVSNRVILYIHGGSFVGGSRASWRGFCSSLASKSCSRVVLPEFRLAPNHPYPAALEDIQSVFRSLFTEEQVTSALERDENGEKKMPEIIISADGSGASIALALLFNLRDKYRSCISHVVLFSPWLDLSPESKIIQSKKLSDDITSSDVLRKSVSVYTYAANTSSPLVSPILATDEQLSNFPPVFIQMGDSEILRDDAESFVKRLKDLGNEAELDLWHDMMFMFQFADEFLHESHLALDKVGQVLTAKNDVQTGSVADNKPRLEKSIHAEA